MSKTLFCSRAAILVFLFTLGYSPGYSQKITGFIFDSESKIGLGYTNVFSKSGRFGIVANAKGYFSFNMDEVEPGDSLYFENYNYIREKVVIEGDRMLVYMNKLKFTVPEKESTSREKENKNKAGCRSVLVGAISKSINPCLGCLDNVVYEIALLLENKKGKKGMIESIQYFISKNGVSNTPFRIRVYKNENDQPGEELSSTNIVVSAKITNEYSAFDLSEYEIEFPKNGIFVSMQWLNTREKEFSYKSEMKKTNSFGQCITLTDEIKQSRCYFRVNNLGWTQVDQLVCDGIYLRTYVPKISAQICY